jgi:hypothetical protein
MRWVLGRTPDVETERPDEVEQDRRNAETDDLDQRMAEATRERDEAARYRKNAERFGSAIRAELRTNHFGERIRAALHQEGWEPR